MATARTQTEDLITGKIQGYQAERRYIRKDGETIWALTSVTLMDGDEDQVRYLSVQAVDIDRRKRAEAALSESERRLQVALGASQIVLKSAPPAYVQYQYRGVGPLARHDVGEQLLQAISSFQAQPALTCVGIGFDNRKASVFSILSNGRDLIVQ